MYILTNSYAELLLDAAAQHRLVTKVVLSVVLSCIALLLIHFLRKRRRLPLASVTHITPRGTVWVTEAAILLPSLADAERIHQPLPDYLQPLIKKLTPLEIAKLLLDLSQGVMTLRKQNVCRAVTISACLYQFQIPLGLVRTDHTTKAMYLRVKQEMELIQVPLLDGMAKIPAPAKSLLLNEPSALPKYVEQLPNVGNVMIHFLIGDGYPSFDTFVKTVNLNQKRAPSFTSAEIKAMATAYAALTRTKIPRSYYEYTPLAVNITRAKHDDVVEKPARLKLVK